MSMPGGDWSHEFIHGGPRPGPDVSADMAARFQGGEDRAGAEWASEFAMQRGGVRGGLVCSVLHLLARSLGHQILPADGR